MYQTVDLLELCVLTWNKLYAESICENLDSKTHIFIYISICMYIYTCTSEISSAHAKRSEHTQKHICNKSDLQWNSPCFSPPLTAIAVLWVRKTHQMDLLFGTILTAESGRLFHKRNSERGGEGEERMLQRTPHLSLHVVVLAPS